MKIIITAGGTMEKIDDVRMIKNMATGKLSSLIAEAFHKQSEADIIYVCTKDALHPAAPGTVIIYVSDAASLKDAMTKLLTEQKIDAVIHAMAVSDYTLKSMTTAEKLALSISQNLGKMNKKDTTIETMTQTITQAILSHTSDINTSKKVSSDLEHFMMLMERTPKIIGLIKKLQPAALLVGFKLLNDVNRQTLLEAGCQLLKKNDCDFVLANDLKGIQGSEHIGLLIKEDSSFTQLNTKEEIAQAIAENVLLKLRSR